MNEKRFLFVCGCPRSGTTALAWLLNCHPSIVLGAERYISRAFDDRSGGLSKGLFTADRFFSIQAGDTFYDTLPSEYYGELEKKYADAIWVGDKSPPLVMLLDEINLKMPTAHVIILHRDIVSVASSYQVRARNPNDLTWTSDRDYRLAVNEWNRANEEALRFARRVDRSIGVTILDYDEFYDQGGLLEALMSRLGLNGEPLRSHYRVLLEQSHSLREQRQLALTDQQLQYVREHANWDVATQLRENRLRR